MKKQTTLFVLLIIAATLLISACGPSDADIQSTVDAARTEAVSTVHARFTEFALLTPSATNTLQPSDTPTATNTLAAASSTSAPTAGGAGTNPTANTCDVMDFVSDVTVPDGEEMSPGETFTKTWRLRNNGTCTWTVSYSVAFDSGDQMSGPATQALTASVAPGATVDISVNMTAPASTGTHSSYWVLVNQAGLAFGSFYVEIEVK